MIIVNDKPFITLADPLYVNGTKVMEVYANGKKVYPEISKGNLVKVVGHVHHIITNPESMPRGTRVYWSSNGLSGSISNLEEGYGREIYTVSASFVAIFVLHDYYASSSRISKYPSEQNILRCDDSKGRTYMDIRSGKNGGSSDYSYPFYVTFSNLDMYDSFTGYSDKILSIYVDSNESNYYRIELYKLACRYSASPISIHKNRNFYELSVSGSSPTIKHYSTHQKHYDAHRVGNNHIFVRDRNILNGATYGPVNGVYISADSYGATIRFDGSADRIGYEGRIITNDRKTGDVVSDVTNMYYPSFTVAKIPITKCLYIGDIYAAPEWAQHVYASDLDVY